MSNPLQWLIRIWPIAMFILLLPCVALAGGKATLISKNEPMQVGGKSIGGGSSTMTLTWQDASTMRMDMDEKGDAAIIKRDGKTYSISRSNGETQVMDMSAMMKMMQAMGGEAAQTQNPFGGINSIKATGKTETVAGIKGRVYHMTWTNPGGSRESGDAVLTDDPLVVEMTRAYLGSMSGMTDADTAANWEDALPGKDRGLLRMGDQMRVDSISRADPPASTFELPAKPVDMKKLMRGMGGR